MNAIDNLDLYNKVAEITKTIEKSMQHVKHFTLMFPFRSGAGVVYTVTIVATKQPGKKTFDYNVSAREFLQY